MDAALLFSGFSGLLAAFVASALWATRPTPAGGRLSQDGRPRVTEPR